MVEFVSYDGKFPNLCSGVLTVKINGKEVKFGNNLMSQGNEDKFWYSGGGCDFKEFTTIQGKWKINYLMLKDEYKLYASELIEVFNQNVKYGCCGGCL